MGCPEGAILPKTCTSNFMGLKCKSIKKLRKFLHCFLKICLDYRKQWKRNQLFFCLNTAQAVFFTHSKPPHGKNVYILCIIKYPMQTYRLNGGKKEFLNEYLILAFHSLTHLPTHTNTSSARTLNIITIFFLCF